MIFLNFAGAKGDTYKTAREGIIYYNKRDDEYCGNLEKHLRFTRGIVEATKEKCGE